jgi:hypothetical protein
VTEIKPWVTGVAPRRPAFEPASVRVSFVVDEVARIVFIRLLPFPHATVIPPMPHTDLNLRVGHTRSTSGRSLGTFQEAMLFLMSLEHWTEKCFA